MSLLSAMLGAKPPYGVPPFAPPHPITGGSEIPTTPETMPAKKGLAGFIDRMGTSPLSQIGLALLAGGGGGLGNAAEILMASNLRKQEYDAQYAKEYGPHVEHVGDQVGILDPRTGAFTPTYSAPHQPTGFAAELEAAGVDPASPEGKAKLNERITNELDPFVTMSNPQGSYYGPRSGLPSAMGLPSGTPSPVGKITPLDDPAPADEPPAGGTLDRITSQSESGGRDYYPTGDVVRSSAGAIGRMQVMPGTIGRPGFGVRPGDPSNLNDVARVGRDYRSAMQGRYGGDLAKMWAAYNWGPGNLDRAISTYGDNWMQALPPETRAYVARNLQAARGM